MFRQQHAEGRLLEPLATLPLSPEQRGFAVAPEPVAAAGEHVHCFALALLAAQGEGRVFWGKGWEEKNGINDS